MTSIRSLIVLVAATSPLQAAEPTVHDPRLRLELVANDPAVVTPIGLAIDGRDRLFVLESHTHEPPEDYDGPEGDRVKIFADNDRDGSYELAGTFAEGIQQGMTLAFGPGGDLFAMTAGEVLRLSDRNGDDRCDGNEVVLTLQSQETYPHNRLLGINFDAAGWMYIGRGNLGGREWSITAPDGTKVGGYGEGGSLLRCRPDGGELETIASGFWNPFAVEVDRHGRLLCVDNDPDARGPNRIVHIARCGDYGYKALYGGGGNHPFQSWNGELPGTLPIASGTGEAPCDMLAAARTALPRDYLDSFLVTVWNENTIERHAMRAEGSSVRGEATVLVSGDADFRPVCLKANSRGEIFITDWVKVDYPNHGRGRIWRLAAKDGGTEVLASAESFPAPELAPELPASPAIVADLLKSDDAFARHRGVMHLVAQNERDPAAWSASLPDAQEADASTLIGYLLAVDRGRVDDRRAAWVAGLLGHDDPRVRQTALLVAGNHRLAALGPRIDEAIMGSNVTPVLLETYLATRPLLEPEFIAAIDSRSASHPRDLLKPVNADVVAAIVRDAARDGSLRVLAAEHLVPPLDAATRDSLLELAASANGWLQSAAIRQLGRFSDGHIAQELLAMAHDRSLSATVRADAVAALANQESVDLAAIAELLGGEEDVAVEAARLLRSRSAAELAACAAQERLRDLPETPTRLRQQLEMLVGVADNRPADAAAWKAALAQGGDPAHGRRVFFSAQATCAKCHALSGTATTLGPNLGRISQSLGRGQLIDAIIEPSAQFAPQYQAWQILDVDGNVYLGLQLDHIAGGGLSLITQENKTVEVDGDDVEAYQASKKSLMPEGLVGNLTVADAQDLVSFLESLK